MKKIIILVILTSILTACGDKSETSSAQDTRTTQSQKNLKAMDVMSKAYIESSFVGATDINLKESEKSNYPHCGVSFKHEGNEYNIILTLGSVGNASPATLEAAMSYFIKKKTASPIDGVGENAYLSQIGGGQISTYSNGNLIHTSVYKNNKFDLDLSKKTANNMLSLL